MRPIAMMLLTGLIGSIGAAARELPQADQSDKDGSFRKFRTELIRSLEKQDVRAVETIVSRKIEFSFGYEPGSEKDPVGAFLAFHRLDREPAKSPFWEELLEVLRLGCVQKTADRFECPYVSANWPEDLDASEGLAVVAKEAEIKATPFRTGKTLRRVGQVTLQVPPPGLRDGWYPVELEDGAKGFVSAEAVRSPIDYRAFFEKKSDRWKMTAFIAGD